MEHIWLVSFFGFLLLLALHPFSDAQTVCSGGWFGSTCQYQCHCTSSSCDKSTGHCSSSSCDQGWFGSSCQSKCYCTGDNCDLANGTCISGSQCISGWFGSHCQYKCHCTDGSCNSQTGECNAGSRCASGWFGPACQYEDLASTQSTTSTLFLLFDGDDTTCNDGQGSNTVTVTLKDPFLFTWLRLNSKNATTLQNIQVKFSGGTSCTNMKSAKVDSNTRDIHCQLNNKVSDVILEGVGVKDLCSVYISGGRNVALKQATEQSSIFHDVGERSLSSNAVDGNRESNWVQGSCTHTSGNESPRWSVRFPEPQMLNRYVVYNIQDNADRLRGFELTSYDENDAQVFYYKDGSGVVQSIYSITTAINTSSISRVTVQGFQNEHILTICEFEAYGDPICPVNKYGRECKHTCNCAVSGEQCFVSTGGCPSGCAAGFYGEDCNTPCPAGTFGSDCSQTCDQNCARGECDAQSGRCTDCAEGWYGQSCNHICNQNCGGDNSCDRNSGDCICGCDGNYSPPACSDCKAGWYKYDCSQPCIGQCGVSGCDRQSGVCIDCKSGWYRYDCSQACFGQCGVSGCDRQSGVCIDCKSGWYRYDCSQPCIGQCGVSGCDQQSGVCIDTMPTCADQATGGQSTDAGLVTGLGVGIGLTLALMVAVAIGLSIYCYRRRQEAKHPRRRTPPGYNDMNPPGQDEHGYHVVYK